MNSPLIKLYRQAEDYFFRGISSKCLDLGDGANAYPHYTQEEWRKIEQSVAELPEQSPLIHALQDYMDLLDKLEACQKY
jgi:hypothetical protein